MSLHHLKGPHSYYQVKPWLKAEARQPAVMGTETLWVAVALMKSITVLHVLLSDPEVPTSQAWPRWSDQEAEWLDTKAPRIVTELLPERGAPSQASPMWLPKFVHSLHNCTGQPTGKPQSRQICLHLTHRLCPKSSSFCSATLGTIPRPGTPSLLALTCRCLARWVVSSRLRAHGPILQIDQSTGSVSQLCHPSVSASSQSSGQMSLLPGDSE